MSIAQFKLGQLVRTNEGREGTVRYIGPLHIASGDWLGLELPDASGKNDGSVKGEVYFTCKPGYGIFVRDGAIVEIIKQPPPKEVPKANGNVAAPAAAPRPRPSASISADVARKRQSIMSNGSASATGSRLSMRSPTKSPHVPASTSASSTTSTPRTGTPSATARNADANTRTRLGVGGRPSMGPPSTTARSSSHVPRTSISGPASLRTNTTPRPAISATKSTASMARGSQPIRTISSQGKPVVKKVAVITPEARTKGTQSPAIAADAEEDEAKQETNTIDKSPKQPEVDPEDNHDMDMSEAEDTSRSPAAPSNQARVVSTSRSGGVGNVETRTAQQREIEQLKAKIRTLEKKRQEDRDKLKHVETLQSDKDRFEGIIQALQKKLRTNQQELIDARSKYEEAEARANAVPEHSGELESELELATLDKEMAEERAETIQIELEALKAKHEELELEVEILREENTELASTMSPEEKASAGWLQMERERERLRDALLRLRDMSQENESDLKAQVEELREQLDEAEKTAGMYVETAEKLTRAESTTKHLMGQLEAVESNDEVVEAMEIQREQQSRTIEQLRNQIQDLEEHIQVTDELEFFHVEEEKRLNAQLDDHEASLSEDNRKILEQDRVIEDLEYTLTKFRDVVQGLQGDIDELRRSREISEMQANEMSSKSRAMMDLNLRLQNNAAKTQTKVIETELNKVNAELASKHVNILSLFTPETFAPERTPILALICFGRLRTTSNLVSKLLGERLRERSHLSSGEEVFRTFQTMESMKWISGLCHRFERYMQSCDTQHFAACGRALTELEPVERTVTNWVEALRRDELARDEPEHLKRMLEILRDLSEKLITDSTETKATEIVVQMSMVENYSESLTSQLSSVVKMVQLKLGSPKSEDEESLVFDKRMDQLSTKARTIKYLAGKVVVQLNDLSISSLCLGETSWALFEEAEQAAELLSKVVRAVGFVIAEEFSKIDVDEPVSYTSIPAIMVSALQRSSQDNVRTEDDPFTFLLTRLNSLQSMVDELQARASDMNNTIEFESQPAPWVVRAKEIKNTKLISPEVQEELNRLERRNQELGARIAEREKTIEEMGMRVEIAEKRFKESKEKDNQDKVLKDELQSLKSEKQANERIIFDLRAELVTVQQAAETIQSELETLRTTANSEALANAAATTTGTVTVGAKAMDDHQATRLALEANLMQAEISALQAAVRYLREENRSLRIPVSEVLINSARNSWLDASIVDPRPRKPANEVRKSKLERDGLDVWSGLIDVAKTVKPVRLGANSTAPTTDNIYTKSRAPNEKGTWQPAAQTTRYAVLKQREELECWEAWRDDFINRAKIVSSGVRTSTTTTRSTSKIRTGAGRTTGLPRSSENFSKNTIDGVERVRIVES